MRERCEYMQEVNSLCKDVEQQTASPHQPDNNGHQMEKKTGKIPSSPSEATHDDEPTGSSGVNSEATKSSCRSEVNPKDEQSTSPSEANSVATKPGIPSEINPEATQPINPSEVDSKLNPQLVDLATEVKDLNVRFASICLQARQHYAALSKVLTASIERHSSLHMSLRSKKSQNRHYVRITGIAERNDRQNSVSRHNSVSADFGSSHNSPSRESFSKQTDHHHHHMNYTTNTCKTHSTSCDSKHPLTTGSPNTPQTTLLQAATGKQQQGVALTSKASVLATGSPNPVGPDKFGRSISVSTSTDVVDCDSRSRVEAKFGVVLRSKSVDCDSYSDSQPRAGRRPKSAVIIEPSGDGETALLSEVQLKGQQGSKNGGGIRRRSMEITLSSLANSGLLSSGNFQTSSTASSPAVPRVSHGRRKRFGSLSTLQPGDRSSVVSVESLDPRTMITGQLQQNSHAFNVSIGSDITGSLTHISQLVPEWKGTVPARRTRKIAIENCLQPPLTMRSVSMDAINKNKGQFEY